MNSEFKSNKLTGRPGDTNNIGTYAPPIIDNTKLGSSYPSQPSFVRDCQVNTRYKTLPQYEPQPDPWTTPLYKRPNGPQHNHCIKVERQIAGPASIKSLYTGEPHYYPPMYRDVPKNTMYGMDTGELGFGGRRETYHFKVYPFTHRHVREVNRFRGDMMPYPDIRNWTTYGVVDSTTPQEY